MSAKGRKRTLVVGANLQLQAMSRSLREQLSQFAKVEAVFPFEGELADLVLLDVVVATEADCPAIRRLESDTSISITTDMSALDRTLKTTGNAAVMAAHPRAMRRALAAARLARPLALKPVREL